MKVKLGEKKVHEFRRSWDLRPDPLDKNNPYHPLNIEQLSAIFFGTDEQPEIKIIKIIK